MADIHDVMDALADVCVAALYSDGVSVTGDSILIYPGWPGARLEEDLEKGVAHVSVFPKDGERPTTRYSSHEYEETAVPDLTLTVSVDGTASFTLGGAVSPSENVAVIFETASGGGSVVHPVAAGETLSSIATSLANLLTTAGLPASAVGPVVTVTGASELAARVGGVGTVQRELRRQERWIEVILWSNHPTQRERIGRVLDVALADTPFLTLADNTAARLKYRGSPLLDRFQKENLYRRDWRFTADYGTTVSEEAAQILIPETNVMQAGAC